MKVARDYEDTIGLGRQHGIMNTAWDCEDSMGLCI
jgi:hypothetical protein